MGPLFVVRLSVGQLEGMAQIEGRGLLFRYPLFVIALAVSLWISPSLLQAQHHPSQHEESGAGHGASGHGEPAAHLLQWEGSVEGKAYSELNHHISALCVLLIGFGELRSSLGVRRKDWGTYLLPGALMAAGVLLLIWSDHDAWPVGHMSFLDSFVRGTGEIVQHKQYGLLALGVGSIELARRREALQDRFWLLPLPLFAIVGGLMLFSHDHGGHPDAQHIAMHHALLGTTAVAAGLAKALAGLKDVRQFGPRTSVGLQGHGGRHISQWDLAWSLLVLVIAVQLFLYRE